MAFYQSFFEFVLCFFFVSPAFDRGIRTHLCFNLYAESYGVSAIVGTAILSGASVADCSAVRWMHHGHALPSTFMPNLFVVGSVKVHYNFPAFLYSYSFQCGEESEIRSNPGNMSSSGFYFWDTHATISQGSLPLPTRNCARLQM